MGLPIANMPERYNYGDYSKWPEGERWELIEGRAYDMSPAPGTMHQSISFEMSAQIHDFLKNKKCRAFSAPFDVRLPDENNEKDKDIETVVQPDIVIVCEKKKLDEKGCRGAPDFVVEILSPYTAEKDMKEKFFLYEKHRVKEYWIVDPSNKTVLVYELGPGKKYKRADAYVGKDKVPSKAIKGLTIDMGLVFAK